MDDGELRVGDADGKGYSKQDFLKEYGDLHKWDVAPKVVWVAGREVEAAKEPFNREGTKESDIEGYPEMVGDDDAGGLSDDAGDANIAMGMCEEFAGTSLSPPREVQHEKVVKDLQAANKDLEAEFECWRLNSSAEFNLSPEIVQHLHAKIAAVMETGNPIKFNAKLVESLNSA